MAFNGVLPPESLSFAGQVSISRPLACQSTQKPVLDRFPSQGPQVPPPVGKPEWSARSAVLWSQFGPGPSSRHGHEEPAESVFFRGHNGGQDTLWKSITPFQYCPVKL